MTEYWILWLSNWLHFKMKNQSTSVWSGLAVLGAKVPLKDCMNSWSSQDKRHFLRNSNFGYGSFEMLLHYLTQSLIVAFRNLSEYLLQRRWKTGKICKQRWIHYSFMSKFFWPMISDFSASSDVSVNVIITDTVYIFKIKIFSFSVFG